MIEIKNLLTRFNDLLLSEEVKIESVKNVLYQVVGVKVKNSDIKIKDTVVYLNLKPIYKSEIFLKKEKLISTLEKTLGQRAPKNIR